MELTFYGHASVAWQHAEGTVLIDPFLSGHPKCDLSVDDLQVTDLLLTHGHEDHVLDAPSVASRSDVQSIAPFEVAQWLTDQGGQNVVAMNHGGVVKIAGGSARMVHAVHSSTLPNGNCGGNPAGYIVQIGGERFYHAGDTALTMEMELIGRHWPCPVAALPVGGHFTMGWQDAMIAAQMVRARDVLAIHCDTFPPIALSDAEKSEAQRAFSEKGIRLHFMQIGERLKLDGSVAEL